MAANSKKVKAAESQKAKQIVGQRRGRVKGGVNLRKNVRPIQRINAPMVEHDQKEFLKKLRHYGGIIGRACESIGLPYGAVQKTRDAYPEFADKMDEVLEFATSDLEIEAIRRGVTGVQEPVFGSLGQGLGSGKIGERTVHSDTLLIFLLKSRRPEVYRDRYEVRTSPIGTLSAMAELASKAESDEEEGER